MNNNKPTFFTSDWHIGHLNVLKFDNRPFKDLDHMHEYLVTQYNATVPEHGICFFLGDIGLGSGDTVRKVIERLNGTKVCILGNHDKNRIAMYSYGFDVVLNTASFYIGESEVTMSHCPLPGIFREDVSGMKGRENSTENWHGEYKNTKYMVTDRGQFHLHGHIHSRKENGKKTIDGRQFDVGVPGNNYRPVSLSRIESWIAKYKEGKKYNE